MPSVCACAYSATDTCMLCMYVCTLRSDFVLFITIDDLSSEEQDDCGLVYSAASGESSKFI